MIDLSPDDIRRFWSHVDKSGDCWLWTASCVEDGYGRFGINSKLYLTHRISYFLEFGDLSNLLVLHTCDNPPCVNPNHLFLGTHSDNMADSLAKGRRPIGDNNWATKVKAIDIPKIRFLAALGLSQRYIANKFEISVAQACRIINFKSRSAA